MSAYTISKNLNVLLDGAFVGSAETQAEAEALVAQHQAEAAFTAIHGVTPEYAEGEASAAERGAAHDEVAAAAAKTPEYVAWLTAREQRRGHYR